MTDSIYRNIISAKQLTDIIEATAQTVMSNPDMADKVPSIITRGAPGVGKSTIVRAVAEKLNIGFVDIRLAQLERVDICGLPEVKNGTTKWCVPSFWPTDKNSAGIIFFDEITAAPQDVQVAAYSMILDRKIPNTDYELPAKWIIVAAGNRAEDRAVARSMSSALANRFVHFELDCNAEEWNEWAVQQSINPAVTGFIQFRPATLLDMTEKQNREQGYPTPRSWEKVSTLISMFNTNEDVLQKCIYGAIGPAVGVEFMSFYRMQKQFSNVLDWLTNPKADIVIPTKADEKSAIISAIAYHIFNGASVTDHTKRIEGLFRILDHLTNDFAALLVHLVSLGNSKVSRLQAIGMLMKSKSYVAWMKKHEEMFNKKYTI